MSYRDTASFGKRMEYKIISEMLNQGLDVYIPLVDDHGVDCVVKLSDGKFIEVQIKARSESAKQSGFFSVDNCLEKENFYYIFYANATSTMWIFTSKEFITHSRIYKSGKNQGRRKINLITSKGENSKKYSSFIKYKFLF